MDDNSVIPSTSKTYSFTAHGYVHRFILTRSDPWDVLHHVDASIRPPSANEVLLRVHAVALSRGGYRMIKHLPSILMKKPTIPEPDVSGTIVSVGTDVRQWAVGDKVFGTMSGRELLRETKGGLTEYSRGDEIHVYFVRKGGALFLFPFSPFVSFERVFEVFANLQCNKMKSPKSLFGFGLCR